MNKFVCQYCLESFKTSNSLLKHQQTQKNCISYRDVIFVCKICNFSTYGIKNIENHISKKSCSMDNVTIISDDNIDYIIEDEDEDNNEQENKIDEYQNKIDEVQLILQNKIIKLENELKKECIKNETLMKIIEHNINGKQNIIHNTLDFETFITENKCGISSPDNASVDESKPKNQFKSYKTLKNCIELAIERDISEIDEKIKQIDRELYVKKQNFGNVEYSKEILQKEFDEMKAAKTYPKILAKIKNHRKKLIGSLQLNDYIELLNNHLKIIKNILQLKGHQEKKINTILLSSLTSLDMRLLYYNNYHEVPLETDDYLLFKDSLEINAKFSSYYKPFNFDEFIVNFYNYASVVLPIKSCLELYIINRYGFNNIVYIPIKQSLDDDPYSFYILEGIIEKKRFWKLDNRLNNLIELFKKSISIYMINVFRNIYQNIFHDNEFRDNFISKTSCSNELNQLLNNIFFVSSFKFYSTIRTIIKEKSTFYPSENDKCNIYSDDPIIRKKNNKLNDTDIIDTVKMIFDNINGEQAVDFYRGYS